MHQRDYILRIIEQLGAVLVELRRRILGGEGAAAVRASLSRVAGQAGYDIELLRAFDVGTLRMFAAPTGELDPVRAWIMAEILYLDGLERVLASDATGRDALLKARALFDLVRPAGGMLVGLAEAADRIREIDRLLDGGDEPPVEGRLRRRRAATSRGAVAGGVEA